jgi:RNA polymerase primary sigma factor
MVEVQRAERSLTEVLGRRPSVAEIADELELTAAQVLEARAARQPVGSLDAPVGDDGELKVADVLSDPNTPDPLQSVVEETPAIDVEAELARLPERTRRIIELRYGLRDGDARTADAVAEEVGVARERVRQIELHTLRKLGATLIPAAQAA